MPARPHGFTDFIHEQGFHGIYLVTTIYGEPVKVGITEDPLARMSQLQTANFIELRMHRFWWTAGVQIAERIEREFKQHFEPSNIRGEWFDLPLAAAELYVGERLQELGTWAVDHQAMIDYLDKRERQRARMPESAPSPLGNWRDEQLSARHLPRRYLKVPGRRRPMSPTREG